MSILLEIKSAILLTGFSENDYFNVKRCVVPCSEGHDCGKDEGSSIGRYFSNITMTKET